MSQGTAPNNSVLIKPMKGHNMSDFTNDMIGALQEANGIQNGINNIDGVVPNYAGYPETQQESHNEIIPVNSIDIPQNVNGGEYDPFTEIQKKRLYNDDGYNSNAQNVRVKRSNGQYLEAGTVGQNYLLITNKEVNNICTEIRDESGMNWEHNKIFFDGKRYRNVYRTESFQKELDNGDVAYLMFTELNSYDGSSPAGFRIDFMILVCKNGMISPKYGWDSKFRHSLGNVNWQEQIRAGALALTGQKAEIQMNHFSQACNTLHNPLSMDNLSEIRKLFIPKLPNLRYGEILTEYHEKEGSTMWDLMQAGTSKLWHRGKMTNADFTNNACFVDGLLDYGKSQNIIATS